MAVERREPQPSERWENQTIVGLPEKEEAIFNPNCRNISLLSVIRDKCYFNRHVELELSDENGQVKNLRDKPQNYASDILREREVLVLLKVNNSTSSIEDAEYPKYTPLLNDEEAITDAFLAQLSSRSLSRPSSRRARSNTSQGGRTPVGRSSSNRAPPTTDTTKKENVINSSNTNNTNNNIGNTNRKGNKTSDGRSSRARTKSSAK